MYFNLLDMKAAIHTPSNTQWTECTPSNMSLFILLGNMSLLLAW